MIKLTLGTDSNARKNVQLVAAFLRYIPAAAARFALHSKAGNDKHNPGEPVHHARGKSGDHAECVLRHLVDFNDIEAYIERNGATAHAVKLLLDEVTAEFWRTGILLQELCEKYEGAPLAPAARLPGRAELNPGAAEFGQSINALANDAADGDGTGGKLPQVADGTPHGAPWCVVDGDGNLLSLHLTFEAAEDALRGVLGFPGPINTPGEAAELARIQGTVKLVASAPPVAEGWLADGFAAVPSGTTAEDYGVTGGPLGGELPNNLAAPDVAHDFPLFPECPSERGNGVDEWGNPPGAYRASVEAPIAHAVVDDGAPRCGNMSRTKRVCIAEAGHAGQHGDTYALWHTGD